MTVASRAINNIGPTLRWSSGAVHFDSPKIFELLPIIALSGIVVHCVIGFSTVFNILVVRTSSTQLDLIFFANILLKFLRR